MSLALVRKGARDYWWLTLLAVLGIVVLEMIVVRMILELSHDVEKIRPWLSTPFVRTMIRVALGAELEGAFSPTAVATLGLGHLMLYAMSWGLLITIASATPAGEIGRGTADLLLTLPVSRVTAYVSHSAIGLGAALLVTAAPFVGLRLGEWLSPVRPPLNFRLLWPVGVNLLALNVSVTGFAMLLSSLASRRTTAVGLVLAFVLLSLLANLLAQFWPPSEFLNYFGFMAYFKPLLVVRAAAVPVRHCAILAGFGVVCWSVGGWYLARRDVPAA